ncbi:MAG: hypothetical protein ABI330_10830 [Caldimonas sp.]
MNRTLQTALAIVAAAVAAGAQADCAPVIAAYAKAEATGRYAVYDVKNIQAAPTGKPFHVDVGNASYTNFGDHYQKGGGGTAASEGSSLKSRELKGAVRCEPLGERKISGDAALGYQVRNNDKNNAPDPTAIHIWISRLSGLPVFHTMGSEDGGGMRWVYGNDVVVPK